MIKHISAVLVLLASAITLSAADLAAYKATYDKQMGSILLEDGENMVKLHMSYEKSLATLKTRATNAGDLNKVKAVIAEIERFAAEKAVTEEHTENSLPDIKKIQLSYIKNYEKFASGKAKNIIALTSKYDSALLKLQTSLTRQNKLSEATTVMEEREQVSKSGDIVAAKAVLDSIAKKTPAVAKKKPTLFNRLRKTKITFKKKDSMALFPKGQKFGPFPEQESNDALDPFEKKPVYFNQKTGRDAVYEIEHKELIKGVRWKGAAMTHMTIEILDMKEKRIAKGGPYEGGNVWGEHTVEFEPRRDFILKISNYVSMWYLTAELELLTAD